MSASGSVGPQKATALVPLALLSGGLDREPRRRRASTAAATGDVPNAARRHQPCPTEAIEAPASVRPRRRRPRRPGNGHRRVVASASTNGIPAAALAAYQRAATVINAADASCHLRGS